MRWSAGWLAAELRRTVSKLRQQADSCSIAGRLPTGAKLTVMRLDLASLASVRQFAAAFLATGKQLHVLMCNAGVMACPFALSADGHELQFATNHLGHFLLTRLLLTRLAETGAAAGCNSRTVVLSSLAHFAPYPGGIRGSIAEVDSPAGYSAWPAYGQSKLANVLFTRELNQRIKVMATTNAWTACNQGILARYKYIVHTMHADWMLRSRHGAQSGLRLALAASCSVHHILSSFEGEVVI